MNRRLLCLAIMPLLVCFSLVKKLAAEGTATVSPTSTALSALALLPSQQRGSYLGCAVDQRIEFRIKDHTTEHFYYGFSWRNYQSGTTTNPTISNMYMRIYDPTGTQVAQINLPTSGNGFIGNFTQASIGANISGSDPGGYTPLSYTPTMDGEYHIELYRSANSGSSQDAATTWSESPYFDMQVATTNGNRFDGRVHCNKWAFVAVDANFSPAFDADASPTIHAWSTDSVILKFDFQPFFRPIAYDLAVTKYGLINNGNWINDRKSANSTLSPLLAGGYLLFLNYPDTTIYAVAPVPANPVMQNPVIVNCSAPYGIRYTVAAAGDVRISLDLNGIPGYQPGTTDLVLEQLDALQGLNTMTWDGKDGLGNNVPNGFQFKVYVQYLKGRFNVPIYDAEINKNGFNISTVAPILNPNVRVYWDDTNLPSTGTCGSSNDNQNNATGTGIDNTFLGSVSPAHAWSGNGNPTQAIPAPAVGTNETGNLQCDDFGNVRVINTFGWGVFSLDSINVQLGCLTASGTLWNDVNGSANGTNSNIFSAGENGTNLSNTSFATLVDPVTGNTMESVALGGDGTYSFIKVPTYATGLIVRITNTLGIEGTTAPAIATLPAGWVITSPLTQTFNTITTNISTLDFGIEELPTPAILTAAMQVNPGGTNSVAVPIATFAASDLSGGIIASITILNFPANAASITINGTLYTSGTFPIAGVSVPTNVSGQPLQAILVDPINGVVTVSIPYKATDNAGKQSTTTGMANIPFYTVSLSGTVFNDVDGATDNTVNGTGLGNPSNTILYANLIDASNHVVATTIINANGTYTFSEVSPATYSIQISTIQGAIGNNAPSTSLPTNWVHTGEHLGINLGDDGNANGILSSVTILSSNIVNANFGIEQLPTPSILSAVTQVNPGGTNEVTISLTIFAANDSDGGYINSITITSFPINATSITIDGIQYTAGTFPSSGVAIPTNVSGQPLQIISVDPINGAVVVSIPYSATDNANQESAATGIATIPFFTVSISGTVFNDINGLTDNTVNGIAVGNPGGSTLYANLLGPGNVVKATTTVNPDGTYTFAEVNPGTYGVQASTQQGTVGSPASSTNLPGNWVNIGEHIGSGIGNDGAVNGILSSIQVSNVNVINANFGIEELPTPSIVMAPGDVNPGGANNAFVSSTLFNATDPNGGTVTDITITNFPSNTNSITVNGIQYIQSTFPGGGISIPTNASGQPTQTILIDPFDGIVNVIIHYSATDNANQTSAASGIVNLPFYTIGLSGTVFNDVDGNTDNTVNGIGLGNPASVSLYVNLLNTSNNVVATTNVNGDGSYIFFEVDPGTYSLQVSIVQGNIGNPSPPTSLPTNWVHTGEHIGTGTGDDGIINGILQPIALSNIDVNDANFGLEELPTPASLSATSQVNPGGIMNVNVPSAIFNASDPSGGNITSIIITSFPTNATTITINGIQYTSSTFPLAGITIPTNANGQPTQTILVDPVDGLVNVGIPYSATDNANQLSVSIGIANMPFGTIGISGTIFNDVNGLSDNTVNGIGLGNPDATILYAMLLDASSNVVAITAINMDGTYTFPQVNPGTYALQISSTQGAIGQPAPARILPANWVSTGENLGSGIGDDGNINAMLSGIILNTSDITNANFGIEELPTPAIIFAESQVNPGGNVDVLVPATIFAATDASSGTITFITITNFPANVTSITIDGTQYTSSTFPIAGVTIPTNANGEPAQTILVDPVDGAVIIDIPYSATDNAGKESIVFGLAKLPVTMPNPDVNVTYVNVQLNGNVSTNDEVLPGTTYGNPLPNLSNPGTAMPVINANGTYTFINPIAGVFYFDVPVTGPGGGMLLVQLQITVLDFSSSINPPTANTDIATTLQNTPVNLNTLANDACGNSGCSLVAATVSITDQPNHGTVTVNLTTGFTTYTPNTNFSGADTLLYQVCDNSIPSLCATAMQIITVAPSTSVNLTSAADDYKSTPLNTQVSGSAILNDVDPEQNIQTISPQTTTIQNAGTLILASNGNFTFTPVSGFYGPVDYPYTTCDDGTPQACAQATIHILVSPNFALPVVMNYFNAEAIHCNTQLYWETSSEENTSYFNVMRKGNLEPSFNIIAKINAAGNSAVKKDYSYKDINVGEGSFDYKIESVDLDGKTQFSETRSVVMNCTASNITVYPNLATDYLNISIHTEGNEAYQIKMTDMTGRVMLSTETEVDAGTKLVRLSTSHMAYGLYNITVSGEYETQTFRVRVVQ